MYISRPYMCVYVSDQGVIIPMSKVEYSCSGDVATPGVLNGHGNAKRRTELYRLFRPGQPPKLADLEPDNLVFDRKLGCSLSSI